MTERNAAVGGFPLSMISVWGAVLIGWMAGAGEGLGQAATNLFPEGRPLRVATKETPPFAIKLSNGTWSGMSIEFWERVAAKVGVEFEYREMELGDMISGVQTGGLDLAVAAITVTPERESEADFSYPYYKSGLGLAYKDERAPFFLVLLRNFFSWGFLSAVMALTLILLAAGVAVWIFERQKNKEQFGGKPWEGLGAGFWWSAVTMTTVGYGDKAPQTLGGRVVALIWMFTSIIIISTFTASIASSVTVDRLDTADFSGKSLHSASFATVSGTTGQIYAQENGLRQVAVPDLDTALDALEEGRVDAVLYDLPILRYRALQEPARELQIHTQILKAEEYGILVGEDRAWLEPLNVAIIESIQEPAYQDLEERYLGNH